MDGGSVLRMLGALALVVGALTAALWIVRRFRLAVPGTGNTGASARIGIVERTFIDSRTSLLLVRRDGREHLVLLAAGGATVLEGAIVQDELDHRALAERATALAAEREQALERLQATADRVAAAGRRAVILGRESLERWRGRRFAALLSRAAQAPVRPAAGKRKQRPQRRRGRSA